MRNVSYVIYDKYEIVKKFYLFISNRSTPISICMNIQALEVEVQLMKVVHDI